MNPQHSTYKVTGVIPSDGKRPHKLTLTDSMNMPYEGIVAWPKTWPQGFTVGQEVEGELKTAESNGYTNTTLWPTSAPKPRGGANKGITEAMNKKAEGIKESMEHKDHSIMVSSTFRDATILTNCMYEGKEVSSATLKTTWKLWRAWLLEEYGKDQRDEAKRNQDRGYDYPDSPIEEPTI